jgi:hypothetical protein
MMENVLYPKIYYAYYHPVEAEDEECANGDKGDDAAPDVVQ